MSVEWKAKKVYNQIYADVLRENYHFAWESSMDPRTKTAAAIYSPNFEKLYARGTNVVRPGLVLGRDYTEEHLRDSDWKKANMIHSENNVTKNARRIKKDLTGDWMVMGWAPCIPCSGIVTGIGIGTYIIHQQWLDQTPERWVVSCDEGMNNLWKKGTEILIFDGEIGDCKARMNDRTWFP